MADLLTESDFRALFNVDAGVPVTLYVRAANSFVRRAVGQSAYDDAVSPLPQDPQRADDLKLVAVYYAIFYAYPVVNNRITQDGVVKSSREEGNTVLTYLSPKEVEQGAEYFRERANEQVLPYALNPANYRTLEYDIPRSSSARSTVVLR